MLPSEFPRLATDLPVRVFPGVWKLLSLLRLPSRTELPPYLLCLFFIFSYLFLKTMICSSGCLLSSASIQKWFCGICSAFKCSFNEFVEEKVLPILFLCHLRTALNIYILNPDIAMPILVNADIKE